MQIRFNITRDFSDSWIELLYRVTQKGWIIDWWVRRKFSFICLLIPPFDLFFLRTMALLLFFSSSSWTIGSSPATAACTWSVTNNRYFTSIYIAFLDIDITLHVVENVSVASTGVDVNCRCLFSEAFGVSSSKLGFHSPDQVIISYLVISYLLISREAMFKIW